MTNERLVALNKPDMINAYSHSSENSHVLGYHYRISIHPSHNHSWSEFDLEIFKLFTKQKWVGKLSSVCLSSARKKEIDTYFENAILKTLLCRTWFT